MVKRKFFFKNLYFIQKTKDEYHPIFFIDF